MAIYHLKVNNVSRNHVKTKKEKDREKEGEVLPPKPPRSVIAAAAYRAGEKLVNEVSGKISDYRRKGGVYHSEIIAPRDAPFWCLNRSSLWNSVEQFNWRKNARFAKEIVIALPRELSPETNLELVRSFVTAEIVDRFNLVADTCWHKLESGSNNPHVHVLVPIREAKEDSFGDRVDAIEARRTVYKLREAWATHCNKYLADAGIGERIDHRRLKSQGIDREPTINIGLNAWLAEKAGTRTVPGDKLREIKRLNRERELARKAHEDRLR